VGFGTFRLAPGGQTRELVVAALAVGYRHIDTATVYGNEADVGAAIRESGIPRDQLWVTTKLWNDDHGADRPRRALEASLRRLGLDYIDLWLMHWPVPERHASWRAMESAVESGLVRSIGVSNFLVPHLHRLVEREKVVPAVNQIELSPFLFDTRMDTVEFCQKQGIVIEAYSPLTKGARLAHPTVQAIADGLGVDAARVLLRWSLQRGFVPLPRTSSIARVRSNFDLASFQLSDDQMRQLDSLDEGLTTGWDPATVA
jgi:diketogulonate reductase-like aldo/keto reductase